MDQVAERLAELRERRALTLRELSDMSGVAADTINQIELGHRKARPSTLRKLAKALNVEVSDFFREPAVPLAKAPEEAGQKDEETPGTLIHALVLERIADLWDAQLSRGFYDESTLRKMHVASFALAMNHEGTISEEDRESLTPNLLEQLEAAEERLVAVDSRIWEVLEKTSRGYTAPPDELAARREAKRQQLRGGRHARHG
jgi:transcriptional regulator with XRE-family HTH domain